VLSQPLHAIRPVLAAVHQDFDGVPYFGDGGSPGGLAGQHFQDGQLEGHFHVSGLAGAKSRGDRLTAGQKSDRCAVFPREIRIFLIDNRSFTKITLT
jgi:hypothetical protein